MSQPSAIEHAPVVVPVNSLELDGDLSIPRTPAGMVLFAHGSGSSRRSPRNRFVADLLNEHSLATLLIDLLSEDEQVVDEQTAHLRFDIPLLAGRLAEITRWLGQHPDTGSLKIGHFGASTGAAAALVAAAELPRQVRAVVSRGGRPDLAGASLNRVEAPTLLIIGGADPVVLDLNRKAMAKMHCVTELQVVSGAGHLFEEPGALKTVAKLAAGWFSKHLGAA